MATRGPRTKMPTTASVYDRGVAAERARILAIIEDIRQRYPINHTLVGESVYGIGPLAEIEQRITGGRPLIEVLKDDDA